MNMLRLHPTRLRIRFTFTVHPNSAGTSLQFKGELHPFNRESPLHPNNPLCYHHG
jgi:hypothetical protein